jgi:dienelactone hydrolase
MLHFVVKPVVPMGVLAFLCSVQVQMGSAAAPAAAPLDPNAGGERVEVQTEDRQTLVATLYAPPSSSKQLAPAALLIHGAGRGRGDLGQLAQRLQKQGFAVLVPDLRGHGDSASEGADWSKANEQERASLWALAGRDVKACAAYLRGLPNVHSSNMSLVGVGAGALLAACHAARDENVRDLVLIEPQLVEPEGQKCGFVLTMAELQALGGLPTYLAVARDNEQSAMRLVEATQRAYDGGTFIQVEVSRADPADILDDRRLPSLVSKWMMDQALPKRGKGR